MVVAAVSAFYRAGVDTGALGSAIDCKNRFEFSSAALIMRVPRPRRSIRMLVHQCWRPRIDNDPKFYVALVAPMRLEHAPTVSCPTEMFLLPHQMEGTN